MEITADVRKITQKCLDFTFTTLSEEVSGFVYMSALVEINDADLRQPPSGHSDILTKLE